MEIEKVFKVYPRSPSNTLLGVMRELLQLWPKFLRAAILGPLCSIPVSFAIIIGLIVVKGTSLNGSIALFSFLFVLGALFYSFVVNLAIGIPVFIFLLKFNRLNYVYTTTLSIVIVPLTILVSVDLSEGSMDRTIYTYLLLCSYGMVVSSASLYFSGLQHGT
ncbi:hypothetical protein EYS14_19080 [Alteromonadaceae bacterium M269]|nr:hypothetical protein EYS14_19080 [Alteromonadaceae bacterium M269]